MKPPWRRTHSSKPRRLGSRRDRRRLRRQARRLARSGPQLLADPMELERAYFDLKAWERRG